MRFDIRATSFPRRVAVALVASLLLSTALLSRDAHAVRNPSLVEATSTAEMVALGTTCESALELELDKPLNLPARAGKDVWLRLQMPKIGHYAIKATTAEASPRITTAAACASDPLSARGTPSETTSESIIEATYAGQATMVKLHDLGDVTNGAVSVVASGVVLVQGFVTSESTGAPLANIDVAAFIFPASTPLVRDSTDGTGAYVLVFPSSSVGQFYWLRTGETWTPEYLHEIWDDVPCAGHDASTLDGCRSGKPVLLNSQGNNPLMNFSLGLGTSVGGRVFDASTGLPVGSVNIWVFSSSGDYLKNVDTDGAGRYLVTGLLPGSIRIAAERYEYEGQLHAGLPCEYSLCGMFKGTLVPISVNAPGRVDFHLAPSSYIETVMTLEGEPTLPSRQRFYLAREDGDRVELEDGARPDRIGPLAPGTYYLYAWIEGESFGQIYQGIDCDPSCPISQLHVLGTPIVITGPGDRPRISMDLRRLHALRGRVTDDSGNPVSSATVTLRRTTGTVAEQALTDGDGRYVIRGVTSTSYYVHVDAARYTDQLHPDIDCESETPVQSCPMAQMIAFNSVTGDRTVDFQLSTAPSVRG